MSVVALFHAGFHIYYSRVATGENWPDVMLSCTAGQLCERDPNRTCGSDTAYVFFVTFFFLSSILVRTHAVVCPQVVHIMKGLSYILFSHLLLYFFEGMIKNIFLCRFSTYLLQSSLIILTTL